jgi:SAM-dependent methyltransferase
MAEIKDYLTYNKAMKKTLWDKCWWLDKIDPTIDTIIDFGCADGALFAFIEHIFPNRFRYVGIDNNPQMLEKARAQAQEKGYAVELYTNLAEAPIQTNSILLLNSVIHEILNYCDDDTCGMIYQQIKASGARYIAIRDMYLHDIPPFAHSIPNNELDRLFESRLKTPHQNPYAGIVEYMLKAEYHSNWDREKEERYLWYWKPWYRDIENYEILFEEDFMLTYHRRVWRKKYSIPLADLRKINTHKKLLLQIKNA